MTPADFSHCQRGLIRTALCATAHTQIAQRAIRQGQTEHLPEEGRALGFS